jgi:hypothetical protein
MGILTVFLGFYACSSARHPDIHADFIANYFANWLLGPFIASFSAFCTNSAYYILLFQSLTTSLTMVSMLLYAYT